MTKDQENKRSMYLAIQRVCNVNKKIWSSLPAFVDAYSKFENTMADINIQREIQAGKIVGIAENKLKEEEEMIQKTIEIAAAVYAYASKINDLELREKVNYSPSFLGETRDTELKDICQTIHDEANYVISNMADYGKSSADLTVLQKEINDYTDILAKPRTAIGTRATATAKLVNLFKHADDLLSNQLDKLLVSFQNTSPKFYQQCKNARIIVDLGIGRTSEAEQLAKQKALQSN